MSISVKCGSDTYSYGSHEGRHYWFLSETSRPSFNRIVGSIAPYNMAASLYEAALCSGYTEADFNKIRTSAINRKSTSEKKKASPRLFSERKVTPRKSSLTNSIKLF